MPKTLVLRDTELGAGRPAIIVPVTGDEVSEIMDQTRRAVEAGAEIVEWRADFFRQLENPTATGRLLAAVRAAVGHTPLLFTVRTQAQGGQATLAPLHYRATLVNAARSGQADLLDVEYRHAAAAEIIAAAHRAGTAVLASHHEMEATPGFDELVARLADMEAMGADVCKLAVMPRDPIDVAELLLATATRAREATTPLITISMGALGAASRLVGETFGSAATFATVGPVSAPGQLPLDDVRDWIDQLHAALAGA